MQAILDNIRDTYGQLLPYLLAFALIFGLLGLWMPCNPGQKFWRRDTMTDLLYFLVMPFLSRFVRLIFLGFGVFLIFRHQSQESLAEYFKHGYGPLSEWPIWLQAAVIFLVSDIILYWTHRLFHGKSLWRFHAIHHSSEQIDWLSTYRFHPVNSWFTFTLVDAIMVLVGFSPEAVAAMAGVNMTYSAMVHANLNWTFGPFRYIFASPVFHRWHHTAQEEGMDKNFAPTFPLLDLAFGTYYMPENRRPERYGVPGSDIPASFIGQIIWPFKKR